MSDPRDVDAGAAAPEAEEQPQPGAAGVAAAPEASEAAEAAEAPEPEVDPRDVALAAAERLRDDYLDQLRRSRADYDNLNKRKTRELMAALDRGAAALVTSLLGVLDTFDLALDAAQGSEDDKLAKGVSMVHQGLLDVLYQAGLEEVPGVGQPFDPTWHEALMQVESEEPLDEPIVAEVLRTGYRFKGRVLRPASVKVAR